jgi:hypothetical protein
MDFITGLPVVDDFYCISTFVDSFTKQAHFILVQITLALHKFLASFLTTFTDTMAFAALSFRIATLNLPPHFGKHFSSLCKPIKYF